MNRQLILSLCLLLPTLVHAENLNCEVESDFDLTLDERSVILTRENALPKWVVIRQDKLFVDDHWVELSAADHQRIASINQQVREIMPLARGVGQDAANIAFVALEEVAVGFSSNPDKTRSSLAQARQRIDARLARSISANRFDSADLAEGIEDAIGEVLPTVIGDIVGGALGAALSGDDSRLQKLNQLDQELESRIEPQAKALEIRAGQLCSKMEALDVLDNALAYRLPSGKALDLLKIKEKLTKQAAKTSEQRP